MFHQAKTSTNRVSSLPKKRVISTTPVRKPDKKNESITSSIVAVQEKIKMLKGLAKNVQNLEKKEGKQNNIVFTPVIKAPLSNNNKSLIYPNSNRQTNPSRNILNSKCKEKKNFSLTTGEKLIPTSLNNTVATLTIDTKIDNGKNEKKRLTITPIRKSVEKEKNKTPTKFVPNICKELATKKINLSTGRISNSSTRKKGGINDLIEGRPLSERGEIKEKDLIQFKINRIQDIQKRFQNQQKPKAINKPQKNTKVKQRPASTVQNKNISSCSLITNDEVLKKDCNISYLSTSNITASSTPSKKILDAAELTRTGWNGYDNKKVNQDAYFIFRDFALGEKSVLFGVCDGHGTTGHEVSAFLKDNLPNSLNSEIYKRFVKATDYRIEKIIEEVFTAMNIEIFLELTIDTNFSGSTCVSLIYTPDRLICANVGDSRCILGRCINDIWKAQPLSRDHKPTEKDEKERILNKKGRIEPYQDSNGEYLGPMRVWIKNDSIPGLAMSRSFGDKIASTVGVIAMPEITTWNFTKEDKFAVLASDGVWEFISNEECVNIVKDFYTANDPSSACEALVEEATRRWKREDTIIDDITVIVVFFD